MFPSFLLALREGLEVALILGIVLGGLRHLHRSDCANVVWAGVATAALLSAVSAFLLHFLGWSLEGKAEPVFEGVLLFSAAALLTWMIFWMSRHARTLRTTIAAGVCDALGARGHRGIFVFTLVAVLREGVELALFLTAASVDPGSGTLIIAGAGLGLTVAALLGWGVFCTSIRVPLRHIFSVTSVALILFAAGMLAKGVHEFEEAGWIPAWVNPVWDTSPLLSERSVPGSIVKGLFGYISAPSLTIVLVYAAYLGSVGLGVRAARRPRSPAVGAA